MALLPGPCGMADNLRQRAAEDLVLQQLTKTFLQRGKAPVQAVNAIDLTVGDGELLGLLGPSGCGKSTTLRMIAGLEEPTSGDIRIGGRSVVGLPAHTRNVAVAFENYALFPPLTVEENITFGMRARGEPNAKQRAHDVAERLGIDHLLDRKPGGLSSGQKQRVSLARAIVRTPSVLLLDEPLSHLDAAERDATRRELKRLQRETGFTTVLVTHDQHEALSLADRVAVMNEGSFQQVGTADDVYDRPANLFVADFVGEPRMNLLTGRLEATHDGALEAMLGPSSRVALGLVRDPGLDGRAITLGIRPQDIRVGPVTEPATLAAEVFAFEPLQELGRLTLDLAGAGQRLVVETHHDIVATPGDAVGLHFDLARTHLFDTKTGARLPWESVPARAAT